MKRKIEITTAQATLADIDINGLIQMPDVALMKYWNGTTDQFIEYSIKHGLNVDWNTDNLLNVNNDATDFLNKIAAAVEKDIGLFDPRIKNTLTTRNLSAIADNDYMIVRFDLSDLDPEAKDILKSSFFTLNTRTCVDFRDIKNDMLEFVYNRKGFYDEGTRIALVKAKQSVTLKDKFVSAKDNNFVISGIVAEFAKALQEKKFEDIEFIAPYYPSENVRKEMTASLSEVLEIDATVREEKKAAIKTVEAHTQAKEEIKKEDNLKRGSLPVESNQEQILKTPEIKIPIVNIGKTSQELPESFITETIDLYTRKEMEKTRLRLEKAKEDAIQAYGEMKQRIADGTSIDEALNIIKQKYREDHTVSMAAVYLTKDILDVAIKDKTIQELNQAITSKDNEIGTLNGEVTAREQTISSLRSTMTTKENEYRVSIEGAQTKIELLTKEAEKAITDLKTQYDAILSDKDQELNEADKLITLQQSQLEVLEAQLNAKTNEADTYKELIKTKDLLIQERSQEVGKLTGQLEAKDLESKSYKELQDLYQKLQTENAVLRSKLGIGDTEKEEPQGVKDLIKNYHSNKPEHRR